MIDWPINLNVPYDRFLMTKALWNPQNSDKNEKLNNKFFSENSSKKGIKYLFPLEMLRYVNF